MLRSLLRGMRLPCLCSVGLVLIACGGGGGSSAVPEPPVTQEPTDNRLLVSFSSEQAVVQFVRDGFAQAGSSQVAEVALAADAGAPAQARFSTSYRLESDVAESDLVQYNGDLLLIAPSRSGGCCFVAVDAATDVAADALFPPMPPLEGKVRVLVTDAAQMAVTSEAHIPLEEGLMVEGMYLDQTDAQIVSSSSWWGAYGWDRLALGDWAGQVLELQTWSLDNPAVPESRGRLRIEGAYIQSRKVGTKVSVISRFTPDVPGYIFYPSTQEQLDSNLALLEQLDIEAVLPKIQWNDAAVTTPSPSACLHVNAAHKWAGENEPYPVVTLVTQVDAQTAEPLHVRCYLGDISGVYVTADHLYLLENEQASVPGTLLHQFLLNASSDYQGSGRVEGQLFLGDQRDFRLNEAAGSLRLLTTAITDDPNDRFEHTLWLLDARVANGEMAILAQLPNDGRPESIGKPNEDLYGVRFLEDRAYAVTFERRDPLYVFDLSDPRDPFIAGSLEIPGFSNFLHPVSDKVLLGIGRSEQNLPKIELFDVSNLAQPLSLGAFDMGGDLLWSYTPSEYDRQAFTVLNADTYRLAVPLSGTSLQDDVYRAERRLYGFSIQAPNDPSQARLIPQGFMSADPADPNAADEPMRSIIDTDTVMFVTGTSLYFAPWSDLSATIGPH